jgi:hypothetical protein
MKATVLIDHAGQLLQKLWCLQIMGLDPDLGASLGSEYRKGLRHRGAFINRLVAEHIGGPRVRKAPAYLVDPSVRLFVGLQGAHPAQNPLQAGPPCLSLGLPVER